MDPGRAHTWHFATSCREGTAFFRIAAHALALGWGALLCCGEAWGQLGQAIPTQSLVDPWNRAAEVLRSLEPQFGALVRPEKQRVERELSALDAELSHLESEEQTVAVKIVSNPEFAYVVSDSSQQIATQLGKIDKRFEMLFKALAVAERSDVLAMRSALASLRESLSVGNGLERDVLQALGSGSKVQIQALAGSWWDASESVGRLREAVALARRHLASLAQQRNRRG